MKKFISLILVFVILMSLSTTAFAFAGNMTIGGLNPKFCVNTKMA